MHQDEPEAMAKMRSWLTTVEQEVGVEADLLSTLETALLALISDVAHGPSRPGAPLTAFLVGVGVGRGGDGGEMINHLRRLAAQDARAEANPRQEQINAVTEEPESNSND